MVEFNYIVFFYIFINFYAGPCEYPKGKLTRSFQKSDEKIVFFGMFTLSLRSTRYANIQGCWDVRGAGTGGGEWR